MTDLTTHELEPPAPYYVVHTPVGYFVYWVMEDTIGHFDANRAVAKQMSADEANEVLRELKRLKISSARIEVNSR